MVMPCSIDRQCQEPQISFRCSGYPCTSVDNLFFLWGRACTVQWSLVFYSMILSRNRAGQSALKATVSETLILQYHACSCLYNLLASVVCHIVPLSSCFCLRAFACLVFFFFLLLLILSLSLSVNTVFSSFLSI